MASTADPLRYPAVVAELRAAGCVFAEDEARLLLADARSPEHLGEMVVRRVAGDPLEYILGWTDFCGVRIAVRPGVFVPRQRTALMVTEAIVLARQRQSAASGRPVVLDLCCGAGAVGAAVAARLGRCEIYASDIDPVAVACARLNLPPDAGTFVGDLYAPLPDAVRGRVDVLVANAPYVPTDAVRLMPPEARLHEPRAALDGGSDGLALVRRVILEASVWLSPDGALLVEASDGQAAAAVAAARAAGLAARVAQDDDIGATVVIAGRRAMHEP
ncbi:putative protein N(5)-glutamine methyltransferase [Nakamurella sp. GG22]